MGKIISGVHHINIKAGDFDKSLKFYHEALGMDIAFSWGEGERRTALLDIGDGGFIELNSGGSGQPQPVGAWGHLALRVDSTDKAYEAALQGGATERLSPRDGHIEAKPHGMDIRIAFVLGPDGEDIELFEVKS